MRARSLSLRRQRGIAMLEALVGILIFAFGVLGLVGLQASMTRAQTSAQFRTEASNLANELVGLMWTDAANVASYDDCAKYARCADWQKKVAAALPGGAATIDVQASGEVQVDVRWTTPGEGNHVYTTITTVTP